MASAKTKMGCDLGAVMLGSILALAGLAAELAAEVVMRRDVVVDCSEDSKALGYPDQRKMAQDRSGNLYVAYRKKVSGSYQIYVARSTDQGITWAVTHAGHPVATVPGGGSQRVPALAIDSSGTLHVVWYGCDDHYTGANERQIKYCRSNDYGATWTPWINPAPVEGYAGESYWQEHPTIFIDPWDAIYVAWQGYDTAHTAASQAKFTKSTDGGRHWLPWSNIRAGVNNQSRPTVLVAASGIIHMLAYGTWNGVQNILWTRSADGGVSFAAWTAVSPGPNDQRHVSATVDGDTLHVVWREQAAGGGTVIQYCSYQTTWSVPGAIYPAAGYFQFFPSIAVYGNRLAAVWTETPDASGFPAEDPVTGQIVYASRVAPQAWAKLNLTQAGANTWASLRRAENVGTGGNIDVIYSTGNGSDYRLSAATLAVETPGPGVSATVTVNQPSLPAIPGCLAAYPNPAGDRVRFVWQAEHADAVVLEIFNAAGERVAVKRDSLTENKELDWDTQTMAPGIYFCRATLFFQGSRRILKPCKVALIR